jgi:hypothetical protein
MNVNSMKMTLLIVGVTLLAIAMFANVNLYMSLANSPIDKLTWAIMGFAFDVAKVMLLILSGALWAVFRKPFAALFSFVFWLVLTGVSLSTLFGYTSKVTQESERQAAINSMGFKSAQANLDSTERRLADMASVAGLDANGIQAKFDNLTQRKAAAETELAGCPRDYVTKCIKPARLKIEALQKELTPVETELNRVREYKGLQLSKASALESSRVALADGASEDTIHPMFSNGATVLNSMFGWQTTGRELKVWFLAVSAFLCELLASFLLLIVATIGGRNLHAIEGIESSRPMAMSPPRRNDDGVAMAGEEALAIPKT